MTVQTEGSVADDFPVEAVDAICFAVGNSAFGMRLTAGHRLLRP